MNRQERPPKLAERILKSAFRFEDLSRLDDFEELFYKHVNKNGRAKAKLWYCGFAVRSLPNLIKNSFLWGGAMFQNYLKIAVRNIRKNKVFSIINITGLALGIAVAVFILNFVSYQLSYDKFNSKYSDIYRIVIGDGEKNFAGSPAPLGEHIKNNFAEVEDYVRIGKSSWGKKIEVSYKDLLFNEDKLLLTDNSFFTIFDYKLKTGNAQTLFENPNSIVISESTAKKYFGDENPMGKTLKIDKRIDLQVTGVMYDFPENSHIHFDLLAPFIIIDKFYSSVGYLESWGMSNYFTYLLLKPGTDSKMLRDKFATLQSKIPNKSVEYFDQFNLEPLTEIHLTNTRYNLEPAFEKKYIYIFSFTALLVLIVACINFINLTTARASNRASEIGLRKVIGAQRNQVAKQFLGEAVILSLLAGFAALLMIKLFVPFANNSLGIGFNLDFSNTDFLASIFGVSILTGLISGLYPALVLSGLQPVKIMQKKHTTTPGGILLKKILVVFQFSVTLIFMIGVATIFDQMNYIRDMEIGWKRENIVNIPIFESELKKNISPLTNKLLQNPKILSAAQSRFIPSRSPYNHGIWWEGKNDDEKKNMWMIYGDYDIVETMGFEITRGRNFSREIISDADGAYLLNEAAVKELGWNNPIGKKFTAWTSSEPKEVVGILKNYNFRSLHFNVEPCVIYLRPSGGDHLSLKLAAEDIPATIKFIENTWKNYTGSNSFEFFFMDDDFNNVYKTETNLGNLLLFFAVLSIIIGALGLFGLATFLAQQKRKEIGIRKVLGASVSKIFKIFTSEFLKLFVISIAISLPFLYKIYDEWMNNFAYKAPLNYILILAAILAVLLIFTFTIGIQAMQSAFDNPIKSIREE